MLVSLSSHRYESSLHLDELSLYPHRFYRDIYTRAATFGRQLKQTASFSTQLYNYD